MSESPLTPDAVALEFGRSREWVLRQARSGKLPAIRLTQRTVRFRREDVDAYVRAHLNLGDVAAALEQAVS